MRERLHKNVFRPPRNHREEMVRFVIVGGCGYLLAMALYAGLVAIGTSAYVAVPPVFLANGLFNFTFNRLWSFPRSGRRVHDELGRFTLVAAASLIVNYTALYLLHGVAGIDAVPAQAVAVIVATPVGFLGNKFFSFASGPSEALR